MSLFLDWKGTKVEVSDIGTFSINISSLGSSG